MSALFQVNPELVPQFEAKGMRFVGHDTEGQRMEVMELADHPFYIAVQFHPEYISRPMKPSPPYHGLLLAACGRLSAFMARSGSPLSKVSDSDSTTDDDVIEELEHLNVKAAAAEFSNDVIREARKNSTSSNC